MGPTIGLGDSYMYEYLKLIIITSINVCLFVSIATSIYI
jgi:hypothetical protein